MNSVPRPTVHTYGSGDILLVANGWWLIEKVEGQLDHLGPLAYEAVAMARITGSVGATATEGESLVTVARLDRTVAR